MTVSPGRSLTCHCQSQYDRMVGEKDAELDETKKKEVDAVTQKKSLVCCLTINEHVLQSVKSYQFR